MAAHRQFGRVAVRVLSLQRSLRCACRNSATPSSLVSFDGASIRTPPRLSVRLGLRQQMCARRPTRAETAARPRRRSHRAPPPGLWPVDPALNRGQRHCGAQRRRHPRAARGAACATPSNRPARCWPGRSAPTDRGLVLVSPWAPESRGPPQQGLTPLDQRPIPRVACPGRRVGRSHRRRCAGLAGGPPKGTPAPPVRAPRARRAAARRAPVARCSASADRLSAASPTIQGQSDRVGAVDGLQHRG